MRRVIWPLSAGMLCALALVAAGCGAPRSGAVSETGPCAQVLPVAEASVHGRGRLLSVKALKRKDLRKLLTALTPPGEARRARSHPGRGPVTLGRPLPKKTCVLVYRGTFSGGPRGGGRYLILLIKVRHPTVLKQLVSDRVPKQAG